MWEREIGHIAGVKASFELPSIVCMVLQRTSSAGPHGEPHLSCLLLYAWCYRGPHPRDPMGSLIWVAFYSMHGDTEDLIRGTPWEATRKSHPIFNSAMRILRRFSDHWAGGPSWLAETLSLVSWLVISSHLATQPCWGSCLWSCVVKACLECGALGPGTPPGGE